MASNLYTHQDRNVAKTWVLMFLFFCVVIGVGWAVSWYFNSPGLLVVAVIFAVVMNVTSYWFSDKIVVKMAGAHPADERQFSELHNIVENLAITAGLPKPKIYVIQDPAPNAFATGRNKEHAVVAVTTGLLAMMNRSELEGVLAHELSHVGNRDMLVSTVAVVLVGFISILSDMFMRSMWFRSSDDRDNRAGGILILVGIILSILAPIFASLIHLAISRRREFLADTSGALLTRYPEGLAHALQKIATAGRPMRTATNATAHLFFENPFGADRNGERRTPWLVKIFSTHPPVEERIAALKGLKEISKI